MPSARAIVRRVSIRVRRASLLVAIVAVAVAAGACEPVGTPIRYPWAVMDSVSIEGDRVVVRGWGYDPDSRGPINVLMAIDEVGTKLSLHQAGEYRPDVGAAHRGRSFSGFTARSAPLAPGPHVMCIAAQNVGAGDPWRLFGCHRFDVADVNPTGNLEALVSQGEQVVAVGWTLDRQTPIPNEVRIDVDGVPRAQARAMEPRDDVAAAFPGLGNLHGFRVSAPITPGPHTVCAVGLNLDAGSDQVIGCGTVVGFATSPFGVIDQVAVEGDAVVARGWAIDPDAAGPSSVVVTTRHSPLVDPTATPSIASVSRPDVGAAFGTDPDKGFVVELPTAEPGPLQVCVSVANRGFGADRSLGCRDVVFADRRPAGALTSVAPLAGGVRVEGTMTDPDTSGAVTVRVLVDGVQRATAAAGPDFEVDVGGLASGSHSVCVVGVDVGGAAPGRVGDRALPCGGVSLGSVAIGTTGTPAVVGPVGPSSSHPLHHMERDAGVSAQLSDGSTLWFFGDSSELDAGGNLKYFVSGTAAWTMGQGLITNDAAPGGRPVTFATPIAWNGPCPADAQNAVMWPMSAVAVPQGGWDRVLVYMENVCLGVNAGESRGLALVEYLYNPAAPPSGVPIVGTVLNQFLRPERTYGTSSMYDGTWVYAYSCGPPVDGGWLDDYGPCHVSRVAPDQAHITAAHTYWNGATWVDDEEDAAELTMPELRTSPTTSIPVIPVASFTVRKVPGEQRYVMVYSPWPGFTDQVVIRYATSPQGPWTAPVQVFLPGCHDSLAGVPYACYAGTAQPQFDGAGRIGIGYFDQLVALEPRRGAYLVATVPLEVVAP